MQYESQKSVRMINIIRKGPGLFPNYTGNYRAQGNPQTCAIPVL